MKTNRPSASPDFFSGSGSSPPLEDPFRGAADEHESLNDGETILHLTPKAVQS